MSKIEDLFGSEETEVEETEETEETELEDVEEELPETDPESDELVDVTIDGRKLKLDAEAAAAVRDFQKKVRDRDGARGGELAQLREQIARMEGQISALPRTETPSNEPQPPDPKLALSDFAAWQVQNNAYIESLVAKKEAELRDFYQEDVSARTRQAQQAAEWQGWADAFYAENEHLDKPTLKRLVSVVYTDHEKEILALTDPREQRARLAELADEELSSLVTPDAGKRGAKPPKLAGQRRRSTTPSKEEPEKRISLADKAKELRAKLRDGRAA